MKKVYLLLLSFMCLCTLSAFAGHDGCCPEKKPCKPACEKPCEKQCEKPCPQPCMTPMSDTFLCTCANLDEIAQCLNLSDSQLCNAHKIQEKYDQEVYSFNDRIQCEEEKLTQLEDECASYMETRKQKDAIKKYKKERNKICDCYEKQFKATLSKEQIKEYNKIKKQK